MQIMTALKKFSTTLLFFVFLFGNKSVAQSDKNSPFTFQASYVGDLVANMAGGVKTGATYLGLANLKVGLDMEKAHWWKGGTFFVNAGNTHGGQPSETLVGDFQGVSNIEAGNLTFMYELWYRQQFGKFALTAGLQDLNADFAVCDNGALFGNSSFGILSSISDNIPAPIFPLTALGVCFHWNPDSLWTFKASVFDGTPDDFERNPYNTQWRLSRNDGFLTVGEVDLGASVIKGLAGSYKMGAYYRHCNDSIASKSDNYGIYFVGDQEVYRSQAGTVSAFVQIGTSPKKDNDNNYYLGGGVTCAGFIPGRKDDTFGIALAYAHLHRNPVGSETALEVTYRCQVTENISLRPDVQYVLNPTRSDIKRRNAIVGTLRFGLQF
jgi:porin